MNPPDPDDPFLWLEEIASPAVTRWIGARNAETVAALCDARFEADRRIVLDLLNADDRIPGIGRRGPYVYNFWQDADHPKGFWRRTTLAEYRKPAPAWDVLLDVDALAHHEGEDWVWGGCAALPPGYRRGLVQLSRGGAPVLMASDTPQVGSLRPGNNFSVSIQCDSVGEIECLFAALGQNGQIRMPLGDTPWGARFGMLTDQFGIQWILNCNLLKRS